MFEVLGFILLYFLFGFLMISIIYIFDVNEAFIGKESIKTVFTVGIFLWPLVLIILITFFFVIIAESRAIVKYYEFLVSIRNKIFRRK